MEFEKKQYSREEIAITANLRKDLASVIDQKRNELKKVVDNGELFDARVRSIAGWLDRELRNLAAANTPGANEVLRIIFDHVTGDAVLKSFQMQTLEKLSSTYVKNSNFQWFINSTFPSLALISPNMDNPFFLNFGMFIDKEGIVQDSHPETLSRLSTEEKMVNGTIVASEGGFYFLYRRPWLNLYILALLYYRTIYSLEWLTTTVKTLTLSREVSPVPDPDSVSTDIPHAVIATPTQLADIGL